MKNNRLHKAIMTLFVTFIMVLELTSCVAFVDDDRGEITRARISNSYFNEIVVDYTGKLSDYDVEVEVYNSRGKEKSGYFITDLTIYPDYCCGSNSKYVITMNRNLYHGDWAIIRFSRHGTTLSAVAYSD